MSVIETPRTTPPGALDALAWSIAGDGIEAHEAELARLLEHLRASGPAALVDHVDLVELVADRTQPAAARERAFGRLAWTTVTPSAELPTGALAA